MNSAMLVATFFSLWLAVYFEYAVEDTLAYILILSFGILHGANDIKLLQITGRSEGRNYSYIRILVYYVVFVLVVAGLFFFIPAVALSLFILFSAYHFGEQHWISRTNDHKLTEVLFFTFYGLLVLLLLFSAHGTEVHTVVQKITGLEFAAPNYVLATYIAGFITVLLYAKIFKQITSDILLELFYLLVFYIVFNTASLLWAFAIYFIIWHSIPSLSDQIVYLYGDFNKKHFLQYLKSSLVYWGISVLALVVLFVFIDDASAGFLPLLFSFLAAITFPHVLVISRLNRS